MITIEYTSTGEPISDFNYSSWLDLVKTACSKNEWVKSINPTFKVSTTLPIYAVRLAIVKNEINHKLIQFKFNNITFQANQYGAITNWPNGFADNINTLSEDILRHAMWKKRKELNVDAPLAPLKPSKE